MSKKKSQGFLVVAENNNNIDFIEMAYVLGMSLKQSQSKIKSLSIITTDVNIKYKHKKIFDKIIYIPKDEEFKSKSKSIDTTSLCASYYDLTPYDETIVLDADFLFLQDISLWWDLLKGEDLVFTDAVRTFRNEKINDDFYRKTFTLNKLPNIYTGLFYFKKSKVTQEFFSMVNMIFSNWVKCFDILEESPKFLSADVAYALAYKILDLPKNNGFKPTFIHMKTRLQNIPQIKDEWTKLLSSTLTDDLDLKINNFSQILPFHYHDKKFLTKDIIETYEQFN